MTLVHDASVWMFYASIIMSLSVFKFYVLNANLGVRRFKIGRNTMNMNSANYLWKRSQYLIQLLINIQCFKLPYPCQLLLVGSQCLLRVSGCTELESDDHRTWSRSRRPNPRTHWHSGTGRLGPQDRSVRMNSARMSAKKPQTWIIEAGLGPGAQPPDPLALRHWQTRTPGPDSELRVRQKVGQKATALQSQLESVKQPAHPTPSHPTW